MSRFRGWGCFVFVAFWLAASTCLGQAREAPPLPATGAGGHVEVSLHARSTQAMARSERAAWLSVTVPLDRAAAPRVAQATVPAPPAAPPPASDRSGPAPRVSFAQLRALSELTRRATAAALAVVSTAAERRRLDSLATRARSAALLPELRLRILRNSDKALRWIPTTDDPYRITQADGTGLILEGAATFRLDRLLFANEELAVERLRQDAGAARLKLEGRVVEAVLGLFHARERACADETDDAERAAQTLKLLELFAELDALTAGWFAQQAPSLGRAVWGFPEAVLGVCTAPEPPRARIPAQSGPAERTNVVASVSGSE